MSAFLCSEKHVHALVLFAKDKGLIEKTPKAQCDAATALSRLNNYAMKARYGDKAVSLKHSPAEIGAASEWLRAHNAEAVAAIAHCFQYQCSEGACEAQKGWPLLQKIVDASDAAGDYRRADGVWSI